MAVVGVRGGPGPEQPRLPASVGGEIPRGKHRELLTPLTLSETDTQPAATQLRLEKEKKEDSRQLGLPVGLTCSKPSTLEAVGGSSSEIEWTNLYYGWPAHRTGAQDESDPAAVPPSSAPDHTRPDGEPQVSVHLPPCTPAGLPVAPLCVSTPHVRCSYTAVSRGFPRELHSPAASLTGADVSAAR